MNNNTNNDDLINALKNAETALTNALNMITASIAKYDRNPHPYIRIPGNPAAEAQANTLCCSCKYCMPSRSLGAGYL
ncbi:hypothetical protein FY134_02995 [Agrobacterium fabrum]|uniref:hypothetical protein n=1 Tax=Agrobacterium fabrum TaxID=1176649 RepID=UPI0021CE88DA|nr:hypothetical protein [Agrobacterium fabrum]UXT56665.1 hypothetical protein FY134_02995 [Agrobacterium fabrum]